MHHARRCTLLTLLTLAAPSVVSLGCATPESGALRTTEDTATTPDTGGTSTAPDTSVSLDLGGPSADLGDSGGEEPSTEDFGKPCADGDDCASGFCVDGLEGSVCTEPCLGKCPDGWSCRSITNTYPDLVFVCVPVTVRLCQPCQTSVQCGGGVCTGASESTPGYCTLSCSGDEPCPNGFECLTGDAAGAGTCAPTSGTCACTAATAGRLEPCTATNEWGSCNGFRECLGAEGFGPCNAATASKEVCDGVDNDCDGLFDEDVGNGASCAVSNGAGTCTGIQTCRGADGLVCSAGTASPEVCNYLDDDCDGETDELFKAPGESGYTTVENCGACGIACNLPNATPACDATKSPPQCVVKECAPGYLKLNEFQCVPYIATVCQACASDTNCTYPGSRCVPLLDGSYCGKPCDGDGDCDEGYGCLSPDGGTPQCLPNTLTCSCDGSNTTLQRACEKAAPGGAGPQVLCAGTEHCGPDGWLGCEVPVEQCDGLDNDCDGVVDGPWVDDNGRYVSDTHCGVCGNSCSAVAPPNATSTCDASVAVPVCGMTCLPDFWDVDLNPKNGCECHYVSDTDYPDGVDQDCDGVDGQSNAAVFVAKNGSSQGTGERDSPLLTIGQGIQRAAATGRRDVYVATGVYSETVQLVSGVSVYGGYRGDFLARDSVLYETAIFGSGTAAETPGTVNALGIAGSPTRLDGVSIFGASTTAPGASVYALLVVDSTDALQVSNCRIIGGNAGAGAPGNPGQSGAAGSGGKVGSKVKDLGTSSCSGTNPGGAAGTNVCNGTSVSGGAGGSGICPDYDTATSDPQCPGTNVTQVSSAVEKGAAGSGAGAGAGGAAGYDAYIDRGWGPYSSYCGDNYNANCGSCENPTQGLQGQPGGPGSAGSAGNAGAGCSAAGTVIAHRWVAGVGGNGGSGANGGGGGGGGAGGGVETLYCTAQSAKYSDFGAGGGGGGSGGCGATGGTGGGAGGGSFAIFMSFGAPPAALPGFSGNVVTRGRGGDGGFGGAGGSGGPGGPGGNGGSEDPADATFCAGGGGPGGAGGNGGHGAGGGGGCGGPSYALYLAGATGTPALKAGLSLAPGGGPGAGGPGGPSVGQPGAAGASGDFAPTN